MTADIPTTLNRSASSIETIPGLLLQVAARLAQRRTDKALQGLLSRPALAQALHVIACRPGIRQGHCAECLGHDATTFGRYIDRLVQEGYVRRTVPDEDRRAVCLWLSDRGQSVVSESRALLYDLEADLRSRMGEADWQQLTVLLARLLQSHEHPLSRLAANEDSTAPTAA